MSTLPAIGHCRYDIGPTIKTVYIGRGCFGFRESKYHNPFKIGVHGDRAEVLAKYELYARVLLDDDPAWLDDLNGADVLLCWCRKEGETGPACHGDVLVKLLAERQAVAE